MATTTEIAPEVFRISIYVPEINLEFSHFLVRDEEPLLFHTGLRSMFPLLRDEVSGLMDVSKLRHIGFSHFESDECGALNHWLGAAPMAQPVCGLLGSEPGRDSVDGQVSFSIHSHSACAARIGCRRALRRSGAYAVLFRPLSSVGHRAPTTSDSIIEQCRETLLESEAGPFANYIPYTHHTGRVLATLAEHEPRTLATMHGSTYYGEGGQALRDLAIVMREVLGPKAEESKTTFAGTVD